MFTWIIESNNRGCIFIRLEPDVDPLLSLGLDPNEDPVFSRILDPDPVNLNPDTISGI